VHRLPALQALAASVRRHGADSLRHYQQQESLDSAALLDLVARTAGKLGWGRWTFDAKAGGSLSLRVQDSPFAAGYGGSRTPVCYPIVGMFGAVADIVVGASSNVVETQCSAAGADACRFALAS
jgi:predicted hydrocarbon binding protein